MFRNKKKHRTFRQDNHSLIACTCGLVDEMTWVPAGFKDGQRLYSAMCPGCGLIIKGQKHKVKSVRLFKDDWDKQMRERQERREENPDENTSSL